MILPDGESLRERGILFFVLQPAKEDYLSDRSVNFKVTGDDSCRMLPPTLPV